MVELVRVLTVALCLISAPLAAIPAAKDVYIVELAGAPLVRSSGGRPLDLGGERLAQLRREQDEVVAAIGRALGREVEPRYRYTVAFDGLALELTAEESSVVAGLPGVRRVQRSVPRRIASDAGPAWTGAPGIWDGSGTGGLPGTKGEGIIIGILDTGISLGHASFADVGGDGYNHTNPRGAGNYVGWCSPANPGYDPSLACNDKLIGVWSYPDAGNNPRDDHGHGTHVASVAAGNQVTANLGGVSRQISGVAPHANLIAYDVCDEGGYCYSAEVLAAADQALADGVDVLNLSIVVYNSYYYDGPWEDPVALALLNAREAGIFVATAAGDSDYYDVSSPENAPWALTVGSSTHNRRFRSSLTPTGGGSSLPGQLLGTGFTATYGPAAIVTGDSLGDYDCSSPFPAGSLSGKIVVCDHYYYDSIAQKGQNVLAGGAAGLVLTVWSGSGAPNSTTSVLPTVVLIYPESQNLYNWLGSGSGHTARIDATTVDLSAANGDIFGRSSWGFGGLDLLDPDVVAPGQEILAAHIVSGGYQTLSGSSMASAHAAGAAALLHVLHPSWTPSEVQSALQTTAVDIRRQGGVLASAFEQGSGRLSLSAAARAGLLLDESAADFEAADPGSGGSPKSLNLVSLADDFCVVSCGWTRVVKNPLGTTTQWNASVQVPAGVSLTVSPTSFVLPPGGSQTLQITASGISSLNGWTFERINLTEISGLAPTAHLPVATLWVPQHQLSASKTGTGTGRVTSSPAGIDCGSDCSELYPEDTNVTLTATPDPGSAFVGWTGDFYCEGPNPICTLPMYYQRSVTAHFNIPAPDKPLTNQVPLKDSVNGPVSGGTWNYYYADLGSGNAELVVDLLDITSDVNLAVRHEAKPTFDEADCWDTYSYGTTNRRCIITNPQAGRWWIGVSNGNDGGTIRYTVRASWGASSDQQLANRSPRSDFINADQPGAGWKYYFFDVSGGSTDLFVELSALSADADLYLRYGSKPDRSNHDCASSEGSTVPDHCSIPNPAAGRWWVGINNFSSGTVTYVIEASWNANDVATSFYTLTPCRLLDTRSSSPLAPGVPRSIPATGACGIPSTARALSANVTITGPTGTGYVVLYPGDEPSPSSSTINFRPGQTRANNAILKLANDGSGTLMGLGVGGQVHLIVDVNGYFE